MAGAPKGSRNTRKSSLRTHQRWYVPWLFLAFGLTITITFILFPFFNTLGLAFTDATLLRDGQFTGLENFRRMFDDPRFTTALLNSTLYVICVVPFMVVLPLILAALVAGKGRLLGFFRTSYYLPVVMSVVIIGLIWTNLLDSRGLVNSLLQWIGAIDSPIPFLTDRWLLLFSAMMVTVWSGLGYYMVIYLAALANIDQSLYDAASVDGAGTVRTFLSVTMPGVRSTMMLIAMFSSIAAFRVFGEVYVLTGGTGGVGGRNVTMTMLIQSEGTGLQAETGYAGAISLAMFVIMGALLLAQLWYQRREEDA
ncbi:carbohydrate ABC transporter permease [Phytoactinopolyspora halotolerans]|uniref:Sugar ABC transporter permease n=1 Tax=Phytoactinopolyspora halotolerans TaxID=1981512 RepID=A0A6L9SDQ1_9ACTN|nr:sugar ABC transporter permease [Phytoactinopolyspora halotolerans]